MNYKYHIDTKVYRIEPYENYVRITGWGFDVNNQNVRCRKEIFEKMQCPSKERF